MGGNIKTEIAFKMKTIPSAAAIVRLVTFKMGAIAEIALPPQIDVPTVMSVESGEGT